MLPRDRVYSQTGDTAHTGVECLWNEDSFWNVLEQSTTSMCIHTREHTHRQTRSLQNKMAVRRKETNLTVKGEEKKHIGECLKKIQQNKSPFFILQKKHGPLVSQVCVGCSGLFGSVPYDTPWATSSQILTGFSLILATLWPHNGVQGTTCQRWVVIGKWQSSCFSKNDDFHVDFCL